VKRAGFFSNPRSNIIGLADANLLYYWGLNLIDMSESNGDKLFIGSLHTKHFIAFMVGTRSACKSS